MGKLTISMGHVPYESVESVESGLRHVAAVFSMAESKFLGNHSLNQWWLRHRPQKHYKSNIDLFI